MTAATVKAVHNQAGPVQARLLILLVAGAMFMENLDGTIIATALPTMARAFGRSAVDLNIGISAYLLALGMFIPASGWAADRFGARRIFGAAIALFTISSVLCGLSNGLTEFVLLRIVQGMAGAMMVPVGRLVVLRNTPKDRLMEAMANLVWPALIAPVLGPPLGGLITTHASWRWIFYLNLPLGIVALVAAWRLVPDLRADERRRFDWPGFGLCTSGIFAFLFGVERLVSAIDVAGVAPTLAGLILLTLAVRHFRRAKAPMIDLTAYGVPTFRAAMRGGSLSRMAVGSAPFLLPLLFQVGFHFSAQASGLLMLGVFGANLAMKSITTPIIRRFGFRPVLIWNGLLCAITLAACALLAPTTPLPVMIAVLLLGGAARSMQFTTIGMISFSDVPQRQMAGANGLSSTISQLSMGLGIALGAMAVRAGGGLARLFDADFPAAPYRIAFLVVAAVALLSLIDALRLPTGAGDRFAQRRPT